jgi:hypothetical protein
VRRGTLTTPLCGERDVDERSRLKEIHRSPARVAEIAPVFSHNRSP